MPIMEYLIHCSILRGEGTARGGGGGANAPLHLNPLNCSPDNVGMKQHISSDNKNTILYTSLAHGVSWYYLKVYCINSTYTMVIVTTRVRLKRL